MGHIISVFVRELPAAYIFFVIFLPVTLLLLCLISYFRIKLEEVDEQIAELDARRRLREDYYFRPKMSKTSGTQGLKKTSQSRYFTQRNRI